MKHFLSLQELNKPQIIRLINLALSIKAKPALYQSLLKGKYVGLLFQKPSLRTKTSFYLGALKLGAGAIYYSPQEISMGTREKIADAARTTSKYLDCVVLRTYKHADVVEFARVSEIPVVNGLSDLLHPSQVLGDLVTINELRGRDLRNTKVSFIGDGNNVCHSLMYAFSLLGGNLSIASPKGYEPKEKIVKAVKAIARKQEARINVSYDPARVAKGADIIYTDVWTSMGKEKEAAKRKKAFKKFQINDKILGLAKDGCSVMHCLPAHRGEEITDSVMDGTHSVVFEQARNRLYSAQAILVYVLKDS